MPRPADWLAIGVGLTLLLEFAQRTQWMKRLCPMVPRRSPVQPGMDRFVPARVPGAIVQHDQPLGYDDFPADFTPGDEYALCGWFTGLLFLTISAALVVGWKRSPGWAKTVLISAAAFTFATLTSCIQPGVYGKSLTIANRIGPFSCVTREIIGQIAVALATLPQGSYTAFQLSLSSRNSGGFPSKADLDRLAGNDHGIHRICQRLRHLFVRGFS